MIEIMLILIIVVVAFGISTNKIRSVKWLNHELPKLVKDGVISESVSEKIENYYKTEKVKVDPGKIISVLTIVGSILIGLGLILIIAFNWKIIPVWLKNTLSFLPLTVSLIAAAAIKIRDIKNTNIIEGVSIFWVLSIGAAIALISQTYHMEGDLDSFLFVWIILCAPIMYIMWSWSAATLFIIGITGWALAAQMNDKNALMYWPFFAVFLPFYVVEFKKDRNDFNTLRLGWLICLSLSVALGTTLEKCLPGLWIIIYSSFYFGLYLLGVITGGKSNKIEQNYFKIFGLAGTVVIVWLLAFEWPWKEIGWNHYRTTIGYFQQYSFMDYIFVVIVPLAAFSLLKIIQDKKLKFRMETALVPLLAIFGYVFVSLSGRNDINVLIFNLIFLGASIKTLASGITRKDSTESVFGLLMLMGLLFSRLSDFCLDGNTGIWIVPVTAAAYILYLISENSDIVLQKSVKIVSSLFIAGTAAALTFKSIWSGFSLPIVIDLKPLPVFDIILTATLLIGSYYLAFYLSLKKKDVFNEYLFAGALVFAAYFLAAITCSHILSVLIMNLYFLYFGISIIVSGASGRSFGKMNVGMVLVAALIIARFIDLGFGLLERGLAFIIIGIVLLSVNYMVAKKWVKK